MKLRISALITLCFIIFNLFTFAVSAKEISLYVNAEKIKCDSPPIIQNDRTLVPVRAIMEALGASVKWNELTRAVTISLGETSVILTINSNRAKVGTVLKFLDCEPVIIDDFTFVPVRFIAETFNFKVNWDNKNYAVLISSQQILPNPEINGSGSDNAGTETEINKYTNPVTHVKTSFSSERFALTITTTDPIAEYDVFPLSSPERIVLDLKDCSYDNPETLKIDSNGISSIRFGTQNYGLRVVIDIASATTYDINLSSDKKILTLYVDKAVSDKPSNAGNNSDDSADRIPGSTLPSDKPSESVPEVTPDNSTIEKEIITSVVIDAGHGGSDTGAIGYNENGEAVLYEKDVNLKVANKVTELLKARGITVYSTRSSDVYVPLAGRTTYANNKEAQLFVSIHSNSFTNSDANGTVTIYSKAKDELYPNKMPSKNIADIIQDNLYQVLGTYDRVITSEDELYVLRHSKMPAVLIELAFISNEQDREILASDSAMSKAAASIADSIEYIINNQ